MRQRSFFKLLLIFMVFALWFGGATAWGAKLSEYETAHSPAADDVVIGTDVSDTTMSATGTTKKFRLQDLPISDPVQGALDGKEAEIPGVASDGSEGLAVDGTISAGALATSGAVSAGDVTASGAVSAGSVSVSGGVAASGDITSAGKPVLIQLNTLADLQSYTGPATAVYVRGRATDGDGGDGTFQYRIGNYAAQCAADTLMGEYIPRSGVPTTTGAWTRQHGVGIYNPRWYGASGAGSTDDSGALNAAVSSGRSVAVPIGTFKLSSEITEANSRIINFDMRGINRRSSILQQAGDEVLNFSSYDYLTNKTYFVNLADMTLLGDGVTAAPLISLGASDFTTLNDLIISSGKGSGISWYGNLCSANRIRDTWFFSDQPWGLKIDSPTINDVTIDGSRFEGSSDYLTKNYNGVLAIGSSKNHAVYYTNQFSTLSITDCEFERISCFAVLADGMRGGLDVAANQVGIGTVFLSHTVSGATVRKNNFVDGASLIDSGYQNESADNLAPDPPSVVPYTNNHGWNSILTDADNRDANGAMGWTFGSGVSRSYGQSLSNRVNPVKITANGSATRTQAVTAGKYYVVRCAWNVAPGTTARSQGASITIRDAADSTVLLSVPQLVDPSTVNGLISYDSWVFKAGAATANVNIEITGLNSEVTYIHLFDLALNAVQQNCGMEEAWSSGLPSSTWTKSGDITISEYTTTAHSGSKCMRVQIPQTVTATTTVNISTSELANNQVYEISFWIKDLSGGGNFIPVQCGHAYIGQDSTGPGRYATYAPTAGRDGWEKITMQFYKHSAYGALFQLIRTYAYTWAGTHDFLIDDVAIVPITVN